MRCRLLYGGARAVYWAIVSGVVGLSMYAGTAVASELLLAWLEISPPGRLQRLAVLLSTLSPLWEGALGVLALILMSSLLVPDDKGGL